ncbi:MAG: hypothetical protein ACE5HI_00680 [bacterium]
MKKLITLILAGALSVVFFLPLQSEAGVRVYVRVGPPKVKTVKIIKRVKPYRNAVWVAGHWRYIHGRYIWYKGYYVKARPHYVYVQALFISKK